MMKKLLFTLGVIILFSGFAYSQNGTIKGVITDQTGEPLAYTHVYLKVDDKVVNYAMSNEKGEYQLFGIQPGTYDIEANAEMTCKKTMKKTGLVVKTEQVQFVDFKINCATDLDVVEVVWEPPVFDADNTSSTTRLSGDAVRKTPGRSITAALSNLEGVSSVDGSMTAVRGNRSDGQQMIVDGVRMRGNASVAMSTVEEAQLIQGGIPAELGDGTSFTVITTKPASKDFHGSAELRGSLEGYNNFLAAVSLSGPILKGKKRDDPARIGFLISGEVEYVKDGFPAGKGSWKKPGTWRATPETVLSISEAPIRYPQGSLGVTKLESEYLGSDAFVKQRVRDHAAYWNYLAQGKIEFLFGKTNNIRLSFNGSYEYYKGRSWSSTRALFNAQNNPESISNTTRVSARLNHRVYTDTTGTGILKNVMYDINVNFTRYNSVTQDATHKANWFNYGYVGRFKSHFAEKYSDREDSYLDPQTGITYYGNIYRMNNRLDTLLTFESGNVNPGLIFYTQNFYDQFSPSYIASTLGPDQPYDENLYSQFGALLNGQGPSSPYSLYASPSVPYSSYSKSQQDVFGVKASVSMNVSNHELKFGFEFEKIISRSYSVSPFGIWTLMRNKANQHNNEIDITHPVYLDAVMPSWYTAEQRQNFINEHSIDFNGYNGDIYVWFDRALGDVADGSFAQNIRNKLGMNMREWVDVDDITPSQYNEMGGLALFSTEELVVGTGHGGIVSYMGYDGLGKKYRGGASIRDFFTKKDGKRTYEIGAYEPTYMAFYLQDKFSINSLLFSVGVRVDYFDANQDVLKDPYLFRDAYTVKDMRALNFGKETLLEGAGDNWYVYVNQRSYYNDNLNPDNFDVAVIGYRDGDNWYNAQGDLVTDPETDLSLNTAGPILKNKLDEGDVTKVEADAFGSYSPHWSVMPRISFSFPVSDNSLFYAHYNIVTSRPTNLSINPITYMFIEDYATSLINNPALKPQRSVDYEIGFRQKIGEKSAISIAAYYSEKRDMIQSYRFTGAYPSTYYSYRNMDFGTVQGFTLSYELRRIKNISFRANYTLQFAKGTGSSASSNAAIIASGQPNLRTLVNLSFDQRHRVGANIDFRFDSGTDYNGPITRKQKKGTNTVKEIRWLENAGITLLFSAASGMPYSRSSTPNSTYVSGTNSRLKGTINGSHRPWIFQCDLRLDKTFILNLYGKDAKDKEGNPKGVKPGYLTVYLDIQNLFNFKNILYVYDYTGNPDDDGFLSAAAYRSIVESQTDRSSFVNYYNMIMQDPYNYSQPTRVSLGVQFGF
ncbi:MAG: TonB-dependent receptor [Bacteroidales bacterium]|nr:TonB-dependent receptor [Bacteroidales bacterium]